jgi:hypothetical protein
VHDYIARLRTQIVRMLDGQGLSPTPRRIGLRHSLVTHLMFVDVAVEELKPHYMRGYGAVAPDAAAALNGIVEELHATISQLTQALTADGSEDLRTRIARIGAEADVALLDTLRRGASAMGARRPRGDPGAVDRGDRRAARRARSAPRTRAGTDPRSG